MTKEEIQALINAKIAGQGSAVDVGGALPAILSEILNLATVPAQPHVLRVLSISDADESEADALARLTLDGEHVTKEQLINLLTESTTVEYAMQNYIYRFVPTYSTYDGDDESLNIFCGASFGLERGYAILISLIGDESHVTVYEM